MSNPRSIDGRPSSLPPQAGQPESPALRSLRARMAAYTLHSRVSGVEHTAPARRAFIDRFVEEVDPQRELPDEERQRRAHLALRAHMNRLALRSASARAAAKEVS